MLTVEQEMNAKAQQREEEEKKKEKQAALNYFTAAYIDVVEKIRIQRSEKQISEFFDGINNLFKQNLESFKKAVEAPAKYVENIKSAKDSFFELPEDPKALKDMVELNVDKSSFATIALCSAGDKIGKVCKFIAGRFKSDPKEARQEAAEIIDLKKTCVENATKVLKSYKDGKPEVLAKTLGNGLRKCCESFATQKEDKAAIEDSTYASEILYVVDKNPKLAPLCGLSQKQLTIAKNIANLSESLIKGKAAIDTMMALQESGAEVPENVKKDLMESALQMKVAIATRQELMKKWNEPELVNEKEQPAPGLK